MTHTYNPGWTVKSTYNEGQTLFYVEGPDGYVCDESRREIKMQKLAEKMNRKYGAH